jgi:hypothetical protein
MSRRTRPDEDPHHQDQNSSQKRKHNVAHGWWIVRLGPADAGSQGGKKFDELDGVFQLFV